MGVLDHAMQTAGVYVDTRTPAWAGGHVMNGSGSPGQKTADSLYPVVANMQPYTYGGAGANNGANGPMGGLAGMKDYLSKGGSLDPNSMVQFMPGYNGISDTSTGQLKSGFQYSPDQVKYDGLPGYDAYSKFALGKGPSDQYNAQAGAIDLNSQIAAGHLGNQTNSGVASGMSNLAATGGLDSGARERLANQGTMSQAMGAQDIYGAGAGQKAGALSQDVQNRFGALQGLTGMQTQQAQLNTQIGNQGKLVDLNNKIQDSRGNNMYDLEGWGKIGDIYGSAQSSATMQAAADKDPPGLLGQGGILGTGLGK